MSQIPALLRQQEMLAELGGPRMRKPRKPRIQQFPKGVEREYRVSLIDLVDELVLDVERVLIPRLGFIESSIGNRKRDVSPWVVAIQGALSDLDLRAQNARSNVIALRRARTTADQISRFNRLQVFRQFKGALGVDVFATELGVNDFLEDWVSENTALIKSIPQQLHDRIGIIARNEFRQGARAEVVESKIRELFPVTRNRAILIARDQSNKLNGQITRKRQTNLGIKSYIWRTSGDDRVRPSHDDNDGEIFRWDQPPAETGHPGQDINCRCTPEPNFEDLF